MGGSMSSLYIGVTGVAASQNAINVTAHNLANVDTVGFVRQQVLQVDSQYRTIGQSAGSLSQVGFGTEILTVRQIRDRFLDQGYRIEIGKQGFYESQYSAVDEVESLFGELEGVAFQGTLNEFWVALQELEKEPDSIVARASIIETAVSFIERAGNISKQLNTYQINVNLDIQKKVDKINSLADKIKASNDAILRAESNGLEKAKDLRDQRNNYLDQLGQLVKIQYREDTSGVVTVVAENVAMVTEDSVNHMVTEPLDDKSPLLEVYWEGNEKRKVFNFDRLPSSTNDTDIGSLKGLILARGSKIGNYTDIPIAPVTSDEEELAKFANDIKEYNNTIKASVIVTVQAQFDQLIHGIVTAINEILCPNIDTVIREPDPADPTDPTKFILKTIKAFDKENASRGMDGERTFGEALFERKSMDRYELKNVELEDGSFTDLWVYNEEDPKNNYSLFTIGEIEVNADILKNYSKLPLSVNSGTGEIDIKTASKLSSLWQTPFATLDPNELAKNNFNDYYNSFTAELANRGQVYKKISESQESLVTSIDDKRLQVTGVSSDEELTNLIKYQHAYNAAARYVNVVSEMLEHLVTRL